MKGLSKVSVQTGTSHGGVPLPGGGVAEVKLDFEVLRALGELARSYGLAGAVQHGASTLPDELFHRFPDGRDGRDPPRHRLPERALRPPGLPGGADERDLRVGPGQNAADERKAGQAEDQFLYSSRKKAIGPFKRALWDLETKDEILASQGAKMSFLFDQLKVPGTMELVERYVRPVPVARPIPDALRAAVAG